MPITLDGTLGVGTPGITLAGAAVTANAAQLNSSSEDTNSENRIINGDFGVWQRGPNITGSGWAADRWFNQRIVGGTVTQSRVSPLVGTTVGGNSVTYLLRQSVSGQTLATQGALTQQAIEGVRSYAGQTITVLGWADRASGTGNIVVEAEQVFGLGGSPSASVTGISPTTVTLSETMQPFAVVLTIPSILGKTLGTDGRDRLLLNFWSSAGSDFSARTNSLGLQTVEVDLWGIHIRVGTWSAADAALYRARDPGTELALCQRYYEAFSATAGINGSYINGYSFSVTKRATPALNVVSGALAGSTWQADTNRFVQINNSSGASGVGFGADSEL